MENARGSGLWPRLKFLMKNSVDYCIIVLFDYCIFYKDFTPKQVNRVHNRGKELLKWEAKAKSRAGRTTQLNHSAVY